MRMYITRICLSLRCHKTFMFKNIGKFKPHFIKSAFRLLKELFILFAASAFRKLSSIYVFSYFPFGFEGRIWDLIVSVPDHCLSFYFPLVTNISGNWYRSVPMATEPLNILYRSVPMSPKVADSHHW